MSTTVTANPQLMDGPSAVDDTLVLCLNTGVEYLYADDGIGEKGIHIEHNTPSGEAQGGHTQATGRYTGPLSLQLIEADDDLPRPAYVLLLRGKYYGIVGDIGPALKKNDVVRIKPPVTQMINPLINSLLSDLGQCKAITKTASSTQTNTVVNTRVGATGVWSLSAWTAEFPEAVIPSGLTIDSSTGTLTLVAVAAGTYQLKVKYTETLTGKINRTGVGFVLLTVTA